MTRRDGLCQTNGQLMMSEGLSHVVELFGSQSNMAKGTSRNPLHVLASSEGHHRPSFCYSVVRVHQMKTDHWAVKFLILVSQCRGGRALRLAEIASQSHLPRGGSLSVSHPFQLVWDASWILHICWNHSSRHSGDTLSVKFYVSRKDDKVAQECIASPGSDIAPVGIKISPGGGRGGL
jgi:hypothetical protein